MLAGAAIGKFYFQKIYFLKSYQPQWRIQDFPDGAPTPEFWAKTYYYPPTKLWEGNAFTCVCLCVCVSVHRAGVHVPITHDALDLALWPPAPALGHPQPSPLLTSGGHDWKPVNLRTP